MHLKFNLKMLRKLLAQHSNLINQLLTKHSNLINQFLTKHSNLINQLLTKHSNLINQLLTKHSNLFNQLLSRQLIYLFMAKRVQMYSNVLHKLSHAGKKIRSNTCFPTLKKKKRRLLKLVLLESVEDGSRPSSFMA